MKLVNDVYEISESFMKNSTYVTLNEKQLVHVANDMLKEGKITFPIPTEKNYLKGTVLDLVSSSVNYCYWYGRYDVRPGDASSTRMYELLVNSFFDFLKESSFSECIDRFSRCLAINRFPLLEERISHLNQLKEYGLNYCDKITERFVCDSKRNPRYLPYFFTELIEKFPGFASDIFLKRASLFFLQLNRRFGWFSDELKLLHVPADYQIPKMLSYKSCIVYSEDLKNTIYSNKLIPKHSLMECEIRSATILAIKILCELTGWNVAEVDGYFFIKRHECSDSFHLCITTDY